MAILDSDDLATAVELEVGEANVSFVAWHPLGRHLVLARGMATRAEVWDIAENRLTSRTAKGLSFASASAVRIRSAISYSRFTGMVP